MRELNNIPNIALEEKVNFTINDIRLFVAPTAISIHKENLEYSYKALRSKVSTKILSGNGVYHAQISLIFPPESLIQLHRLICQVRNNPFVYIENDFVKQSMMVVNQKQGLHFTLIGLSVTSHPSSPMSHVVELDLRYFNHKPFGNEITYRKNFHYQEKGTFETFSHRIFPNYKNIKRSKKLMLFKGKGKQLNTSRSINNVKNILKSSSESFINKSLIPASSPVYSNAYKRYSNFLQAEALWKSFNIKFALSLEDNDSSNSVVVGKKLLNAFQGIGEERKGNVLGFHEILDSPEGVDRATCLEFRRNLIHEMLSSSINTTFLIKEYKFLKFEGDFLKRYRETLNEGLDGLPFLEKQKARKAKEKRVLELVTDSKDKKVKNIKSIREKLFRSFSNVEIKSKFKSVVEINSKSSIRKSERAEHKNLTFSDFFPIVSKPTYFKVANGFQITSLSNKEEGLVVYSPVTGTIEISDGRDSTSVTIRGVGDKSFVFDNIKAHDDLINFWLENKDVKQGDIIGFIPEEGFLILSEYPESFNNYVFDKNTSAQKSGGNSIADDFRKVDPVLIGKLKVSDQEILKEIQVHLEEEGYSTYSGRFSLENILEKAKTIVFGSNQKQEDIESITGKKVAIEELDIQSMVFNNLGAEITSMSCSLKNIVASIPLIGYEYPTHQFLGSVEPVYQINLIGSDIEGGGLNKKLQLIEGIRAHTSYYTKNFPQIPDAGNFYIDCFLTRLIGSHDRDDIQLMGGVKILKPRFIASSTNTFTVEGSPGTAGLNFRFSESKSYYEEELRRVQTTKVDKKYLQKYSKFIQDNTDLYSSYSVKEKQFNSIYKSRLKNTNYTPYKWKTRTPFKAETWYRFRKKHLDKIPVENLVSVEADERAYRFCLVLDEIQKFLDFYSIKKKKRYAISIFSTLDRPGSTTSRKIKSNHFANTAADIRVLGMNAWEFAAIVQALADAEVIKDPTGNNRTEGAYRSFLGMGVYGSNTLSNLVMTSLNEFDWGEMGGIGNIRKGYFLDNMRDVVMDKSGPNGFVHLDLNAKIGDDGNFIEFQSSARRWAGQSGSHELLGGSNIVKSLRRKRNANDFIKKNTFEALDIINIINEYVSQSVATLNEEIDAPISLPPEEEDTNETTADTERHKGSSTRQNQEESNFEYNNQKKEIEQILNEWNAESKLFRKTNIATKDTNSNQKSFSFDLKGKDPAYINGTKIIESGFLTNQYNRTLSKKAKLDLKKLENILKAKNYIVVKKLTKKKVYSDGREYLTPIITLSIQKNLKHHLLKNQRKSQIANNKLLANFQKFASVILTEPYLYVDNESDIIKEMERIKKELGGFSYFPCFYNSIESSIVRKNQFLSVKEYKAEIDTQQLAINAAIEAGAITAGVATALAKGLAISAVVNPLTLGIAGAIFIGLAIADYGLSSDAKLQIKRIQQGIKSSFNVKGSPLLKNINKYAEEYSSVGNGIFLKEEIYNDSLNSELEKFLKMLGNQDELDEAIDFFIKNIYVNISIFKDFSKFANELSANSTAKHMINRSMQEILKETGTLNEAEKYKSLAVSNEITAESIREYLEYLIYFPANYDDITGFVDSTADEAGQIYELDEMLISTNTGEKGFYVKYLNSYKDPDDYFFFKPGTKLTYNDILNSKKYPYLITDQIIPGNTGSYNFFKRNKEKIINQQNIKIAFLKNILEELLKESMVLNREILQDSGNEQLLTALDQVNIFELMATNSYPDILLPDDPRDFLSNKNLGPDYIYLDVNDLIKTKNVTGSVFSQTLKEEEAAKNIILESSVGFVKNRRKGIYSGSKESLSPGGSLKSRTLSNFFDKNQLLRSVSDIPLLDSKNTNPMTAKIKAGLPSIVKSSETALSKISKSVSFTPKATLQQLASTDAKQLKAYFQTLDKKNKEKLDLIQSSFGSGLGYKKTKFEFLEKLDDLKNSTEDLNINESIRTIGVSNETQFKESEILNLSEDSSKEMYTLRSMKKAFPTFRLYIIEEDSVYSEKLYAFDDFFYYNSVIGFNFHNSRELVASVASIQLQNISGVLDGSKKESLRDIDLDKNLKEEDLPEEGNFIDSIILRPGITVQLRAGYESNTNELDILLSGKVTEINYSQDNTICNLTVQSFEVELELERKGNQSKPESIDEFYSTHQLLGSLMMSEELKHFGRHKVGALFQIGETQEISLDLEDYKSSVRFSLSNTRTFMDTFRENAIMISFGLGVTFGAIAPLTKFGLNKTGFGKFLVDSAEATFKNSFNGRVGTAIKGFGSFFLTPGRFFNRISFGRFGLSANQTVINAVNRTIQNNPAVNKGALVNNIDEAIEVLLKYGDVGQVARMGPLTQAASQFPSIFMANLNVGGVFQQSFLKRGPLLGTISGAFRKIFGKGAVTLDKDFVRTLIKRERGLGSLMLEGFYKGGAANITAGTGANLFLAAMDGISFTYLLALGSAGVTIAGAIGLVVDFFEEGLGGLVDGFSESFREDREKLGKKYLLNPQDDNIFAPDPRVYMNLNAKTDSFFLEDIGEKILSIYGDVALTAIFNTVNYKNWADVGKDLKILNMIDKRLNIDTGDNRYVLEGQTIWEVLRECTLKHPGYIYGARPYKNSIEYRVFFGLPSQRYFSKKISDSEVRKLNLIYEILLSSGANSIEDEFQKLFAKEYSAFKDENNKKDLMLAHLYSYWLDKTTDRFTPFRQFHFVSSSYDLISNNIITTSHNVINTAIINYIKTDDPGKTSSSEAHADIQSFEMRANSNIGNASKREKTFSYRNCINEKNAFRYGLGELLYGCRKMYEGGVTIIGNTKINPWDVIILNDNVTDMHGPVEVCSVTHMFSHQTGFITEVEVNSVVTSNEDLSHPMMMQSVIYESRKDLFEEYSSFDMLGRNRVERKENINKIIDEKVEEIVESRLNTTLGIDTYGDWLESESENDIAAFKREVSEKIYKMIQGGDIKFLQDIVGAGARLPAEFEDLFKNATNVGATLSGGVVAIEVLRGLLQSRSGLSLTGGLNLGSKGIVKYLNIPKVAGGFFLTSLILGENTTNISGFLSDSYASGSLGKNLFRSFIMSRIDAGNVIEVYPLVKDGMPLLAGGFEEVDKSEVWQNVLGSIFNQISDGMYGYLERKKELNSLGKRAIRAYEKGELDSFYSFLTINTGRFADLIGIGEKNEIIGYFYDEGK